MSVINRVPRGWLGTLDAKTGGQTPKEPLSNLTPVYDLTANYLADINLQSEATLATFGSVVTPGALVTVPAGELWYVYGVSGIAIATAIDTNYHFSLVVDTATGVGAHVITGAPQAFIGGGLQIGENYTNSVTFPEPWLCGSGVTFGMLFLRTPTGTTMSCTTSVLYRPVTV